MAEASGLGADQWLTAGGDVWEEEHTMGFTATYYSFHGKMFSVFYVLLAQRLQGQRVDTRGQTELWTGGHEMKLKESIKSQGKEY